MSEKVKKDIIPASMGPEITAKKKAIELTLSQIDKQYGKGSVMLLGQSAVNKVESISTGSILIDNAIGIGGVTSW